MHRRNKKKRFSVFLIVIILIIFLYTLSFFWRFPDKPIDLNNKEIISFQIPKGSSLSQITEKLAAENLIANATVFKIWLRLLNAEPQIQAGTFPLSASYTPREILEVIKNPKNRISVAITIPEGFTISKIDERLATGGLIIAGDFINCVESTCKRKNYEEIPQTDSLEGYLFPDTYFVNPQNFQPQFLLDKMLENFHSKWTGISQKKIQKPAKDVVIIASMVEKEVNTDPDRPIVSGILWRRLEDNWALGVDATTIYATGKNFISGADLRDANAYNTRINKGLPPTAISNPGLKSIEAALNPQYTDYRFYITDPENGRVIYARTNDEQNANRARYLQ